MIYTVGNTESYKRGFEEAAKTGKPLKKLAGGSVWKTKTDAMEYLRKAYPNSEKKGIFSVYGVDADWNKDAMITEYKVSWRTLKRDAVLVELDKNRG